LDTLNVLIATFGLAFAPVHAQASLVLRPLSVQRSSVTSALVPRKIAMGQSDVRPQFRSLAIEDHAFIADTSQHRQSEWRRIGKGALVGMLLGFTPGLLIRQQENKKCDVACSMPAYRAVELGLLGSVLGAVVAAKWPHKEPSHTLALPGRHHIPTQECGLLEGYQPPPSFPRFKVIQPTAAAPRSATRDRVQTVVLLLFDQPESLRLVDSARGVEHVVGP